MIEAVMVFILVELALDNVDEIVLRMVDFGYF